MGVEVKEVMGEKKEMMMKFVSICTTCGKSYSILTNPMTRTKQTCKKSTGGTAKRITVDYAPLLDFSSIGVDLGFDSSIGADLNSDLAMEETVEDEETGGEEVDKADGMDDGMGAGEAQSSHNEWCIVCRDGSSRPRVSSTFPSLTPTLSTATTSCSRAYIATWQHKTLAQKKHALPTLDFTGTIYRFCPPSSQSAISSTPVVLIHLTLVDFETSGGPFDLMYRFLSPYFPRGGIAFHELVFDVGSKVKSDVYQVKVGELVRSLMAQRNWPRIVFAISNHTDDDLGDPFLGYERKKKLYVSGRVDGFLDIILTPWQPLIRAAKDSYLWFLSCGALVNNEESFSSLQKAVLHHHITATICFNAIRFQPNFAAPLLLSFAELVLTECLPIREVFPDMLMQSYKLGRHTDIRMDALQGMPLGPPSSTPMPSVWMG
ncbi:hypothetical protein DEU56DRAFT_760917 [Suillus clintonianus]|uniref:uncharacterized protein n=1 Tax=Suillus clintonianus TaxID=1904413 RepID=UPI001B880374|nr:uncharacterized protein DEU56DRAFT_760917 [Suillus clintonianus]KAG2120157.1 hypothetical protein DEU56DRAFT_760917 [Suillus clintonianus]